MRETGRCRMHGGKSAGPLTRTIRCDGITKAGTKCQRIGTVCPFHPWASIRQVEAPRAKPKIDRRRKEWRHLRKVANIEATAEELFKRLEAYRE